MRIHSIILPTAMFLLGMFAHSSGQTPQIEWLKEFGTLAGEDSEALALDAQQNVYITGFTHGDLAAPNLGSTDMFLAKYDPAGNTLWSRQLGTAEIDVGSSVAVDSAGNAYIAGYTTGTLGGTQFGGYDAFLTKYSAAGDLEWTRQLGTAEGDLAHSVDVDANGNIYISGNTTGSLGGTNAGSEDAFIAKYDQAGSLLWTQQVGDSDYNSNAGISVDTAGNVFISSSSRDPLIDGHSSNWDISLTKYDTTGILQWSKRLFTPTANVSSSTAVDPFGNAYVSGTIVTVPPNTPNFGKQDNLLIKFDPEGEILWTRQLGTELQNEFSHSLAVDDLGNAFVIGTTDGRYEDEVFGDERFGSADAYIIKYDGAGNHLWAKQLGTSGYDSGNAIAVDALGGIYIAGDTNGSFGAPNPGGMYVAKLVEIPEPSSCLILLFGIAVCLSRCRRVYYCTF